jgi:transcriptional regulator with XRE-family HTH domain
MSHRKLGQLFKTKRRERGLTQKELARMVGVSRPSIAGLEKTGRPLRFVSMVGLMAALRVGLPDVERGLGER